jgi:hypothetical protein
MAVKGEDRTETVDLQYIMSNFNSLNHPDQLWGTLSFLSSGYWEFLSREVK